MNSIIYLGQVTACTAVFYLFYYLFLRKLTFFSINRWYLLSTVILSFLIPLIKLDINEPKPYTGVVEQVVYTYAPPQAEPPVFIPTPKQVVKSEPITWREVLRFSYYVAVVGLTIHLLITLMAFYKRLKGKRITKLGNVNILSGNNKISNGSFLNYIFVNEYELSADEIQQIIAHEMMHVRLYHSVDRILVKLAQIVLWFNPFIYLYARSVEENHEFEVDRAVANNTDKHNYANLLLHLSVAGNGMLYHNFSKVPLKKRITMLFIKPTTNMKKVIYLLFVPVVLFSGLAFARLKKDEPKYSAIDGVEKLSENVLVMIDGKKYPKEVLYKISPSCMKGWGVFSPDPKLIKYGVPIKDGLVEIKTREGKIVDMSRNEWDNIVKERSVPQSQFYARIHLKYDDGREYDRVIIHAGKEGGSITNVRPGDKVGALIDEKFYDEAALKTLSPAIIASLSGNCGVAGASNFPNAPQDYAAIFSLKTIKSNKADLKGAVTDLPVDTNKYRQKLSSRSAQIKAAMDAIAQRPEYKRGMSEWEAIKDGSKTFKVLAKGIVDTARKHTGFLVSYNGVKYGIKTNYGQPKQLNDLLSVGDEVQIKALGWEFSDKNCMVNILPAYVIKNGQKIFELAEAKTLPDYAFLYEANKVRYADGQLSNVVKYANGKWKTAVLETVNGYKFSLSFKQTDPDMSSLSWGDHVRLRFIGEKKTGAKTYQVNWVAISDDIKDYGIKEPTLFPKFYVKADKLSANKINNGVNFKAEQIDYSPKESKIRNMAEHPYSLNRSAMAVKRSDDITEFSGGVEMDILDGKLTAEHVRIDTKNKIVFASINKDDKNDQNKVRLVMTGADGTTTLTADSLAFNYQKLAIHSWGNPGSVFVPNKK